VGKYFLPVFLERKIYTMPQFLERRFGSEVRTSLAVFWLLVYVFVNLTSVLYLGALSIQTLMGVKLVYGIIGLALFAALYTIYGGLTAVAWTDVIQVVFLVGGGLMTTFLALLALSDGGGIWAGFTQLMNRAPQKFDMILHPSNPSFKDLPGIRVLFGGIWVAGMYYWGCNQYITQRALAAKSLAQAQKGVLFAAYLKLLMPLIVVIPGIAAFALDAQIGKPDEAYPWLLHRFVPTGFKGIAFAALIAAIVSSLSSMTNSTATIFTMDIYRNLIHKNADEQKLVRVGRIISAVALLVAVSIAPFLSTLDQAFQFIQEFTGFVSPGIFTIFMFGLFYPPTTSRAVMYAAILTIPLSLLLKVAWPELPFLDRMGLVFLILSAIVFLISRLQPVPNTPDAGAGNKKVSFATDPYFNAGCIGVFAILAVLYTVFW
jgi:SSS family solute:Na+ symporter